MRIVGHHDPFDREHRRSDDISTDDPDGNCVSAGRYHRVYGCP